MKLSLNQAGVIPDYEAYLENLFTLTELSAWLFVTYVDITRSLAQVGYQRLVEQLEHDNILPRCVCSMSCNIIPRNVNLGI